MRLIYHRIRLRHLLENHRDFLSNLDCGYELAKYMFTQVNELEQKMDIHIKEINRIDNKKFKTFCEGYVPNGIIL